MKKKNKNINTMERKTKKLWLIKLALTIAGKVMLRDLNKKSKNCRKAQHNVLMDIISWAENTDFGKEHNFKDIKSIEDFQKNVPINDYEGLKPYILRHTKGESNVLFPGKPIIYATTSGTTNEPKWIPITEKYYKECYNGLSKLWLGSILKENPNIFDGPEVSIVGKPVEGYVEDGTPFGSFSGHMYNNIPEFIKGVHILPASVYSISSYYPRYYCIMRLIIEFSIRLIITGNPSTLIEMNRAVNENIDDIINDIKHGTLSDRIDIPDHIRKDIEAQIHANPMRAEELEKLKNTNKTLYPKHYWPKLELVNTWKCGNSGLYLENIKNYYDEKTKIREFSYLATEARAGIILNSDQMDSILAAHLLFFEFIKKDEINNPKAKVYLASELEVGEYYYIFVTTPSGLYRYDMNDIIKVENFYNEFPMFRFIQKGAGVTSLTGEKLHESQLLSAVKQVEDEMKIKPEFYVAFADYHSSSYRFFAEFKNEMDDSLLENYLKNVDHQLQNYNCEYESKRVSNRIKPIIMHKLEHSSFEKFKAACMEKGFRDGQFKLTHLMIDDDKMKMFKNLSVGKEISFNDNK